MSETSSRQGTMIVVVGPSGAGKDSLIDFARQRLARYRDIGFVRRFITRNADAGSEDHHAVSLQTFGEMRESGQFAVHWGAHGLYYGIPADTLGELAAGKSLIANGSRAALGDFLKSYADVTVITVTAAPEVIAERLKSRGREDDNSIVRRLARAQQEWPVDCRNLLIDNSGALADAGHAFLQAILDTTNRTVVPTT